MNRLPRMNFKTLFATALCLSLINSVDLEVSRDRISASIDIRHDAYARSSGGRSGGGSFSRGSSSRSGSSSSSRSSSPPSSSRTSPSQSNPTNRGTTGGRASGGTLEKPTSPTPTQTKPHQPSPSSTHPSRIPHPTYRQGGHSSVELEIEIENDDDDFQNYPPTSYPGTTYSAPPPQPNQTLPNSALPAQPNQSLTNPGSTNSTTPPPATAPATNPTQAVNYTKSANSLPVLIILLFFGVGIFLVIYLLIKIILSLLKRQKAATNELENDIVTVSKLQVALFAHTPNLQSELSELALTVDTTTPEGLLELLQESALVLLRHSDTWSHGLSSSQSVNIEEAKTLFTKLSVEERSKFSAETLSNVGGRVRQKVPVMPDAQEDPAAYIVVTLLVGTADDHPLFGDIRSAETLNQALKKVASVRPDYLMTVELLWSPQSQDDSLTYDELLTEYTDMIQII